MSQRHDAPPRALIVALLSLAAMLPSSLLARGQAGQPAPPATQDPPAVPAANAPAGRGAGPQAPTVVSPDVLADRRVTFRLYAPQATDVSLRGVGRGGPPMTKNAAGIWETTVGPVAAGAYRYSFNVHGATVVDPSNQAVSESTTSFASLLVVPGTEWMDTKAVPHGAIAQVHYPSTVLGRERRMHVYTPAGYSAGRDSYPVLYLLHGSGDSDQAWSAVGRAGAILDNLIAAKRAKPMIVVMPFGHTRPGVTPTPPEARLEFVREFMTDIVPFVEKTYRVRKDRLNRAVAGLSMGGGHTMNIVIPNMDKFAYAGVFSAGLSGGGAGQASVVERFETDHKAALENESLRKSMKLIWFSTGREDTAMTGTTNAVNLLKKYGFAPVFQESAGGHTWENWRDYLVIFTQQVFQ